jgi:sulfur-oxidizing protein SoxX
MRNPVLAPLLAGAALLAIIPLAPGADEDVRARAEAAVRRSFSTATPEEWRTRLDQDEVNALCSAARNAPGPEAAARILEASRATLKLPEDGRLMGDWREGEKLASIGTGGHIGRIQPDRPGTRRGGNCYACHVLAAKEVAAGNLGPSLQGYGRRMGTEPSTVRYVYEKIWNAQAFFPCSPMPRFGANGWLTPQEVAHAVAFLLDPDSPVNK